MVVTVVLIVLGAVAAYDFIISKRPDIKDYLSKILPYTGTIGVVSLIFSVVLAMKTLALTASVGSWQWAVSALASALCFCLGIIYGLGIVRLFLPSNLVVPKLEEIILKLLPFKVTLGLASILVGVLYLFI